MRSTDTKEIRSEAESEGRTRRSSLTPMSVRSGRRNSLVGTRMRSPRNSIVNEEGLEVLYPPGFRPGARMSISSIRKLKMVKKGDRGGKDKGAPGGHHDSVDDRNKSPEPYVCTGKFHEDFNELCSRASLDYTPSIVPRARRPGTPPPPPEAKPEKGGTNKEKGGGKDKGKKGAEPVPPPPPEPEPLTEEGEPPEPPPKTYVIKDRFDYFKPNIHVEMDNPDKHDTVTELYIRGWRVDDTFMNIFKQCWMSMEKLHTINLWNAGLKEESIKALGLFLPQCANLKTLFIEANSPPITAENYHLLIGEDSHLVNLSLRHNSITDTGAQSISKELGGYKNPNAKLISLNLTGNKIGDLGAKALAEALRMNRTLLSLSLAQNDISDSGAKELAQVLKCFPLTHEEVVERRKLRSDKGMIYDGGKSPPPSRRADSKDRPGSHRSNSHLSKDKRDKSSKKKDEKADTRAQTKGKAGKEAEKTQPGKKDGTRRGQATAAENPKAPAKGGRDKKGTKGQTKGAAPNEPESASARKPEASDVLNPLLEQTDNINDQLWVPGNRVLINLNLQRNMIGVEGVNAFKLAMQYQDTILSETSKAHGTGLMRLILNSVDLCNGYLLYKLTEFELSRQEAIQAQKLSTALPVLTRHSTPGGKGNVHSEEMKKLTDLMLKRDPLYKPPPTPDPAQEPEKSR